MVKRNKIWLIFAVVWFAFSGATAIAQERFGRDSVDLVTQRGQFTVSVEMAVTWAQRAQGLQHRKGLAPNTGMLFDYGHVQSVSMWMKNTYIPLDMLFIGADGVVVYIARNTKPLSLDRISSQWPVRAVLELPGGSVAHWGILPGDRVLHPIFGGTKVK